MNRISLIQKFINEKGYKVYLEIGTYKGVSFLPIKCKIKIAVDPKIRISYLTRIKLHFTKRKGDKLYYFQMTSDKFFQNERDFLQSQNKVNIVLVDGLHTFKASLNDVLNSLNFLSPDGIIIMHDCYPPNKAAGTPATSGMAAKKMGVEGWTGTWCGDVWKTIVYLRERYADDLEVHVLNTDFGLGTITFKKDINNINLQINESLFNKINNLDYGFLISNPNEIIGLKEIN